MKPWERPCISCGGGLRRYAHWGICPKCEPTFYKECFTHEDLTVLDLVGLDPMRDKGVPTRGGKKYGT